MQRDDDAKKGIVREIVKGDNSKMKQAGDSYE